MPVDATITLKIYEIYTATQAGAVTTLALTNQKGVVCVQAPTDTQVDTIRLYRRGGSILDTWHQVGTNNPISGLVAGACGAGYYTITDNSADSDLGNAVALDNDQPVTSVTIINQHIPFIWGPFDNRVLGCGDPARPDAVYFSKRGNADEWGSQQWVTVSSPSDPMMGGCVYNTRGFAFSMEKMYELVPYLVQGVTFTPFPTPCSRGLISPWGLAVYDAIYFVSKDGIYRTTGGQEDSIVEDWLKPLFPTKDLPGRSVHGYEAVDMTFPEHIRLAIHNDEIYFTYKGVTTGSFFTFMWDIRKQRWRAAQYTPAICAFYSEPATTSSLLVGGHDGDLYQTTLGADTDANTSVVIRTGAHDQGQPLNRKEYGNVIFDLDPGGATVALPVTITPYINGEASAQAAITITGSGRQQVPLDLSDFIAFNVEFEITWTRTSTISPTLYQYDILWRAEPVGVKHWEARETSHGLPGYQHIRDMNITLRSTDVVTLTLTLDGTTTQTYSIASTGGARKKVYVPMNCNKFKLVRYQLDSPSEFRIYEADLEVRVKPWLTVMQYQLVKPFGAEGGAQAFRAAYGAGVG